METVKKICKVSEEQEKILTGHQKPILLLDKLPGETGLCESIAPGNPKVGVMLPYAPVQLLLFHYDDGIRMPGLLVMTGKDLLLFLADLTDLLHSFHILCHHCKRLHRTPFPGRRFGDGFL